MSIRYVGTVLVMTGIPCYFGLQLLYPRHSISIGALANAKAKEQLYKLALSKCRPLAAETTMRARERDRGVAGPVNVEVALSAVV